MLNDFASRITRTFARIFFCVIVPFFVMVTGVGCLVASAAMACILSMVLLGKWLAPVLFVVLFVILVFA